MDFRRPGEHPVEDQNHHFDGTDGTMPPVQAPVSVPQPKRSKGHVLGTVIMSVLLLAATGFAVYSYLNEQSLRQELASTKSQLDELRTGKDSIEAKAKSFDELQKSNLDTSDPAQKIRVTNAASKYFCMVKDFGCDKVAAEITKFQAAKVTEDTASNQEGFAIVTATPTSNSAAVKFYLKSRDGFDWVVIYDGQNVPPSDVANKFTIPASFL